MPEKFKWNYTETQPTPLMDRQTAGYTSPFYLPNLVESRKPPKTSDGRGYKDKNPYYEYLTDKQKEEWRQGQNRRKNFDTYYNKYLGSDPLYRSNEQKWLAEYLAFVESRWNPQAQNEKTNAKGLFQIMPQYWGSRDSKNIGDQFLRYKEMMDANSKGIINLMKSGRVQKSSIAMSRLRNGYDANAMRAIAWLSGLGGLEGFLLKGQNRSDGGTTQAQYAAAIVQRNLNNPKNKKEQQQYAYADPSEDENTEQEDLSQYQDQEPAYYYDDEDNYYTPQQAEYAPPEDFDFNNYQSDTEQIGNEEQPYNPLQDVQMPEPEEPSSLFQSQNNYTGGEDDYDYDNPKDFQSYLKQKQALEEQEQAMRLEELDAPTALNQYVEQLLEEPNKQFTKPVIQPLQAAMGGHLFGNGGDGRTTLPHVGDSWRNTETGESGTVVGYAPDADTVTFAQENKVPQQKRIHYQWYNNPRHQQLMEERLKGVSPLDDPDAPAQPIQSHYQVNPVYWGNTTVQGEPVNITGYKDNKTGIAQYQDGEYGYVNLPENYGMYMMDGITVTPERSALRNLVQDYVTQENDTLISPLLGAGDSEIQPIKFSDASAEPYKAQDLDRFFANLITGGLAGTEEEAARQFKKGNYGRGIFLASLPAAGISGWPGHLIRGTQLAYNLGSDEGIPKSIDMINDKNALGWMKSATGDLLSIPLTVLELGNSIEGFNNNVLLPTAYTRTLPGYYARTALDLQRNPLTTLKAIGKGDYIHNYSSLRKAVEQARKEIEKGTTHTQNYYQNALKVDIPRPEIDVRTKIDADDPLGQFNHNTNRTAYKLYKNSTSNLTRKPQEYQFTGGHEGTHYTEQYLYDKYGFPQTSKYVRGDEYFTPNENHPIMYNGRIQEFMEAPGTHGKSPEETWANFLGHKAANIEQPFDEFNMYQEGIQSPYLFIPEMERYIKELSPKALQKEGEIQLFNKVYGNKALGGTISGNSDSMILADNNNYILADDPTRPNFYIYTPKNQVAGLHIYRRPNEIPIFPILQQ